ncbi:MAG: hypothetical protein GC165_09850 [Armatimonadetes bacterium]|nr:hypothetical protein [Armatimonadota bacterium]
MKRYALLLAFLAASSFGQFDTGEKKYPTISEGPLADILDHLQPRQLGPTNMGGRIMDIAVQSSNSNIFYVASASGGLWKTVNGGISFDCVFDYGGSVSMGAIGLSKSDPNVIYIGTGEQSSRNSVAWGDGVYKSTDGGKTWKHMGLTDTRHISKVVVDPHNPNIVYVAALGRLWGRNPERGVYKSIDGGKTWNLVFTQGDRAGIIDLDMDPSNPNILYACAWDRLREAYVFKDGGMDAGIFKSTDAGKTWKQLKKGLPTGDLGRIGLAINPRNPRMIIATVEYRVPGAPIRVSNDENDDEGRVKDNGGDQDGDHENEFAMQGGAAPAQAAPAQAAKKDDKKPAPKKPEPKPDPRLQQVRGVQMNGGGTFISKDGGESWDLVWQIDPRPFYFSTPLWDPSRSNSFYLCGMNLWRTEDSGKTWNTVGSNIVHADQHALWVDPKDSNHIITGDDGGIYQSRDHGDTWEHCNKLPIGQFYAVSFDGQIPYWVYGGLQDNGGWALPTQSPRGSVGPWDATNLNGGDGFYAEADHVESQYVYSESQGGAAQRLDRKTGQRRFIQPRNLDGKPLRYNWNTPIHISPHDNKTIYIGANHLMMSTNRGDTWKSISPDLTTMSPKKIDTIEIAKRVSINPEATGAENHCTIVTIDESPMVKGRIACGSDDGLVNITNDGGETWTDVTANLPGLPANTWISRVTWSHWQKDRLYVCADGHRNDDFKPYLYVSDDAGKTFRSLSNGLADWDCLYVIREGEHNPNLLFLGSEMSLRFSVDNGKSWSRMRGAFPTVAVHDLKVHPLMKDLVIATHGRSIWTIDVAALEGMGGGVPKKDAFLGTSPAIRMPYISGNPLEGNSYFMSPNSQPKARFYYYLTEVPKSDTKVSISLKGPDGVTDTIAENSDLIFAKGLNRFDWVPRLRGVFAPAGTYEVTMKIGTEEFKDKLEILDPKTY